MTWNPNEHPDDVNLRWSLLRAIEWGRWPIFLSQPVVPVLLLFLGWKFVVVCVIATNLLWAGMVRYRFVSIAAAYWGAIAVKSKWLTCPATAVYLFASGQRVGATIAILWPLLIVVVGAIPTTQVGKIQNMFMAKLGYECAA